MNDHIFNDVFTMHRPDIDIKPEYNLCAYINPVWSKRFRGVIGVEAGFAFIPLTDTRLYPVERYWQMKNVEIDNQLPEFHRLGNKHLIVARYSRFKDLVWAHPEFNKCRLKLNEQLIKHGLTPMTKKSEAALPPLINEDITYRMNLQRISKLMAMYL